MDIKQDNYYWTTIYRDFIRLTDLKWKFLSYKTFQNEITKHYYNLKYKGYLFSINIS